MDEKEEGRSTLPSDLTSLFLLFFFSFACPYEL